MNYIREINAFCAWLMTNELSSSAILVWYALMQLFSRSVWKDTLTIPYSALMTLTSLSRSTVYRALDELYCANRIWYEPRRGNQRPRFKMLPFGS